MSRPIGDAEDYQLLLRDGNAWTHIGLDWNGRLYLTGYEGETSDDWQATGCTSHGLADIKRIHEMTGAVIARLEGRQ